MSTIEPNNKTNAWCISNTSKVSVKLTAQHSSRARMERALVVAFCLSLSLSACAGYGISQRLGPEQRRAEVTACKASCAVFDNQREVCIEYHEATSQHCIDLLTERD
jgi:hypothetical protein